MNEPTPPPLESPPEEPGGMTVDELLERITPRVWVTPTLTGLILVGFGIELALGVSLDKQTGAQLLKAGGQFGPSFADGEWWRALSAMFLHAGLLHLAFNLWAFWSIGKLTERVFGNVPFLAIYLLSGIGGSLASLAWSPMAVGVGASGAIFGVYGALLAFMLLHRGVFPPAFLAQQRNSIVGFIGYNVVFGLSQKNTDMAAHAGGLVTGALAGAVLARDMLAPSAHRLRRGLGAAGVAVLLLVLAFVVRAHLLGVPAIRAQRDSTAAGAHLSARRYPEAIALYTAALAHERTYAGLFNRGLAHLGARDLKHAREDLHDADLLSSTPRTKALLCELGAEDGKTQAELADADGYCTAAIGAAEAPQERARLLSLRAYLRGQADRADDSLADAEAALALDEHADVARTRRALIAFDKGQLDAAERDCERLVAEPSADGFTAWLCSRVAHGRSDRRGERARLDQYLATAPRDRDARAARGWLNQVEGRLPEAIADYGEALAVDASIAETWNNRAWAEVELGDFAAARADAERAIALQPGSANALGTRCFALAGLEEVAAARADCARAMSLGAPTAVDSGMLAFLDKRYAVARRDWQRASEADPSSARALGGWLARLPKR